jgi:hypothetical protein
MEITSPPTHMLNDRRRFLTGQGDVNPHVPTQNPDVGSWL